MYKCVESARPDGYSGSKSSSVKTSSWYLNQVPDKDLPLSLKIPLINSPLVARLTVISMYGAIDPNMDQLSTYGTI